MDPLHKNDSRPTSCGNLPKSFWATFAGLLKSYVTPSLGSTLFELKGPYNSAAPQVTLIRSMTLTEAMYNIENEMVIDTGISFHTPVPSESLSPPWEVPIWVGSGGYSCKLRTEVRKSSMRSSKLGVYSWRTQNQSPWMRIPWRGGYSWYKNRVFCVLLTFGSHSS